jgi:hypothetical protein
MRLASQSRTGFQPVPAPPTRRHEVIRNEQGPCRVDRLEACPTLLPRKESHDKENCSASR